MPSSLTGDDYNRLEFKPVLTQNRKWRLEIKYYKNVKYDINFSFIYRYRALGCLINNFITLLAGAIFEAGSAGMSIS